MKPVNLIGETFGNLTVIGEDRSNPSRRKWVCFCACGASVIRTTGNLKHPRSPSCGCTRLETNGRAHLRHGNNLAGKRSKEYRTWAHILGRCTNTTDRSYKDYGGRGVTVCERWRVFENFLEDMGPAPSIDHSIDRIDNDGHYAPENCRWTTRAQQARNTRRTIKINGVCLKDVCNERGISYGAVQARLRRGHPRAVALSSLTGSAYRAMLAAAQNGSEPCK